MQHAGQQSRRKHADITTCLQEKTTPTQAYEYVQKFSHDSAGGSTDNSQTSRDYTT